MSSEPTTHGLPTAGFQPPGKSGVEPPDESNDTAWTEVEALLEEIAALAKTRLSAVEFYSELLDRAVRATTAHAGAVWLQGPGQLQLAYQVNYDQSGVAESRRHAEQHLQLVHVALRTGEARIVPPCSGSPQHESSTGSGAANPVACVLVLAPVVVEGKSVAVVELFYPSDAPAEVQRGYQRFLEALAELAAEHHTAKHLRELRQRESLWTRFTQFALQIHRQLDLRSTAYAIANQGRRLIECDRVTVLIRRGRKYRVAAISGVESFNRRSTTIRLLERLAARAAISDEALWYDEHPDDLPPQVEKPLQAYVDQSHARLLALIPLLPPAADDEQGAARLRPRPHGLLVVEHFAAEHDEGIEQRTDAACQHSEVALHNAVEIENLPLMPLVRGLACFRRLTRFPQLSWTLLTTAMLAAFVAALVLVPAEFNIEVRGSLQPAQRRDVFAPADGVVSQLLVEHGSPVEQGAPVAVLTNQELDLEFARVAGEVQTAQKRLEVIRTKRIKANYEDEDRRPGQAQELTAEEEEVKVELASLEAQLAILQQRRDRLTVVSPLAGSVLTWDVGRLLESRPVRIGQPLITVADMTGPWQLELELPDPDAGHVLFARQEHRNDPLPVTYILASNPGKVLHGKLATVGLATNSKTAEEASVDLTVSITKSDIAHLRPGTQVTAKVYCGQRSLGYVWFHDLWAAARTYILY